MTKATVVKCADELEQIRIAAGGILRPVDVVEFAIDPNTALHGQFTWDDTEAARKYRIWQARMIIQVTVTVLRKDSAPVRAYVSLDEDRQIEGGGYRLVVDVLRDPTRRKAMLAEARRDMDRFQEKYAAIKELSAVFAAMKKVRVA